VGGHSQARLAEVAAAAEEADTVHRRAAGLQRGGDPRPEHRAAPRIPRRPRTRVRGHHRVERLDRLDDRARRRPVAPVSAGHLLPRAGPRRRSRVP
jgi:hypothetical protein